MLLKILGIYIMRVNRLLIDDLEKIYYSIRCETENYEECNNCKNKKLCNNVLYLMHSLQCKY